MLLTVLLILILGSANIYALDAVSFLGKIIVILTYIIVWAFGSSFGATHKKAINKGVKGD